MKVLVTGVNGQLGYDVMNELNQRGHEAVGSDITAVSGATVSSKAMVAAVNSAVAAVELVKGGSGE